MYLERSRERHKKRMNRNFLIITVGFAIVAILVAYALEHIMIRSQSKTASGVLHCEIENQCGYAVPCRITYGDVIIYEDTVQTGKSDFSKTIFSASEKNIFIYYGNQTTEIQQVAVRDSVSYLMIQLVDSSQVIAQFFE